MPTIKEKLYFNFDGVESSLYNLVHVNMSSGMFEEAFSASRDIVETTVAGNYNPYFSKVNLSPYEFELNLAFTESYTDQQINEIVRWLFPDYYKPLFFIGEESKVFYCMPIGEPMIVHNGLKQGHITLNMRCNSPYIYSPSYLSPNYTVASGTTTIVLPNMGHTTIHPEISITKNGNGNISIVQRSNGGKIFDINELTNLEKIYINCEKEIIQTDIIGIYRYGNVVGEFPKLNYGNNTIEVTGNCEIQFRYQYKYKF